MGKVGKASGVDVDWTQIILKTVDKASDQAPFLVFAVAVSAPVFLIFSGMRFYYRHQDKKIELEHKLKFEKVRLANRNSHAIIEIRQRDLPLQETKSR